jgi:hypothetical protein
MPLAMQKALLLLSIALIIILTTLYFTRTDGFYDLSSYSLDRQKHFSKIGLGLKTKQIDGTLGNSANSILNTETIDGNHPLATGKTDLSKKVDICEAVKTSDCSAFDNPAFNKDCGLCLEIGENSMKVPTQGGLVVLPVDKEAVRNPNTASNQQSIPPYVPTVGSCPADRLVTTKAECQRLTRQLKCEKSSSYDLPDCSQCYSTTEYSIVDAKANPGVIATSGKLSVYGTGLLTITEEGYPSSSAIPLGSKEYVINIRGKEGTRIKLKVSPPSNSDPDNPTMPQLAGLITGPTQAGKFGLDLRRIVLLDEQTGRKPRSDGNTQVNGQNMTKMAPGFGRDTMNLVVIIPFSFVDPTFQESSKCRDAPFVATQAGSEFLESDPCYKKGSGPGKFSLECLQGAWVTSGCTEEGAGYPANASTASSLMAKPDGTLRTLNEISDFIYNRAIITSTGANEKGVKLDIKDWSNASVFCTGRAITSPCDTATKDSGPLTPDCISYLWTNQGSKKLENGRQDPLGATYTGSVFSLFSSGTVSRFCQDSGSLAPSKSRDNIKYWQKFGGVQGVKNAMNNLYNAANAQQSADDKLAPYFSQCYGETTFAKPPPTVPGLLPSSYTPKQNTVIASNINMTQNYILSMDITPAGVVGNWASIIHFTTGPDCCDQSHRSPGIWFAPGTVDTFALHIGHSNDGGWAARPSGMPFAIGKTSKFKLECMGQNITVTVDGVVYKYKKDGERYSGRINTVYGSDPWYPAANCLVENVVLQVIDDPPCASRLLPLSYTPSRGSVMAQSLAMTEDYKLVFDITPSGILGEWASIITFTSNNSDWGGVGCRTPCIWFVPGTLNLHVRIGDSNDFNWGYDSIPGCSIGVTTRISLECKGSSVILKVGSTAHPATQPTYRYSGNVIVYGSGPWHASARATIKNLCLTTQTAKGIENVGFVRIEGNASSSYLNMSQLAVYDINGKNVSTRRTTKSSGSPYGPPGSGTRGASEEMANDGDERPRPHPYEFHGRGNNDFWEVKLDGPTTVSSVKVFNRSDCCHDRMGSGFFIKLYSTSKALLWTSSRLSSAAVQTIRTN